MNTLDWSFTALIWIALCAMLKRDFNVNITPLNEATRRAKVVGRILAPVVQFVAYLLLPVLFIATLFFGKEDE